MQKLTHLQNGLVEINPTEYLEPEGNRPAFGTGQIHSLRNPACQTKIIRMLGKVQHESGLGVQVNSSVLNAFEDVCPVHDLHLELDVLARCGNL